MSAPVITKPTNPVCKDQAISDIIESIALQETGLAHIINAEGEKIQKALELASCIDDLERINASVKDTLTTVTNLEVVLQGKLDSILACGCKTKSPCSSDC